MLIKNYFFMKLIEKIEIEKFRSFWLWKNKVSIDTLDLNIFSWKNNSWKSNILKALNLFFNWETWFNEEFNFDKDYNKAFTTSYTWIIREVKIRVYFSKTWKWILKNWFYIEKNFKQKWVTIDRFFYKDTSKKYKEAIKWQETKQFNTYLNKIHYFYIPAIRDKNFIKFIFKNLQQVLDSNLNDKKSYESSFNNITSILEKRTLKLWKTFQDFIWIETNVSAPTKILDILEGINLNTNPWIFVHKKVKGKKEKIWISIWANSSWDWITMSYLPHFLDFLSDTIKDKKFIWWFEEPENSLEYARIQDLSKKFLNDFTLKNQIFLTTHNPAFIKLKESDNTSFYRVYKEDWTDEKLSKIETEDKLKMQLSIFEKEDNIEAIRKLDEEINFVEFSNDIEKIVEERQEKFIKEKEELRKIKNDLEIKINILPNPLPDNILICEDSDANSIKLWNKFMIYIWCRDVTVLSSEWSSNNIIENWIDTNIKTNSWYSPYIFRQIDRDGLTDNQITKIEEKMNSKYSQLWKRYLFQVLNVNELENYAIISNVFFTDSIHEQNRQSLIDKFEKTSETKLQQLSRFFNYKEEELFKDKASNRQKMRDDALVNWKKYLPWKDIWKLKTNFNCVDYILSLDDNNYPQELKDYLKQIKDFFDS